MVEIEGDAAWLRQLAINLIDNAIKFAEPGGRVSVRLGVVDEEVRFAVSDAGIGISPDRLPHVFERFYQADAARSAGGNGHFRRAPSHVVVQAAIIRPKEELDFLGGSHAGITPRPFLPLRDAERAEQPHTAEQAV